MTAELEMINDRLYQYQADNGDVYSMEFGKRGILSRGNAWYFRVHHNGSKQHIATFTVKSDGNRCEEEDYGCRVWKGVGEILPVANEMMNRMLPKDGGRLKTILINAMQLFVEEKMPVTSFSEMEYWKHYLDMLGTDLNELAALGIDIDELTEISY